VRLLIAIIYPFLGTGIIAHLGLATIKHAWALGLQTEKNQRPAMSVG
jgi:hypothetical protein